MGSWGTGISSNDIFDDIKIEFFEKYNNGENPENIKEIIIHNNQELINSYEDKNNFWFALSYCLWESQALDEETLNIVKDIINSEQDLKLWKELEASSNDITKRKKVLTDFLIKISTRKSKPKTRKTKKLKNAIFQKGDCVVIKINSTTYSGALVLESEKKSEFGLNLIALLDCFSSKKPSIEDIHNSSVLASKVQTINNKYEDSNEIHWFYSNMIKKSDFEYEIIGQIEIKRTFNSKKDFQSFANWLRVPEVIEIRKKYYDDNGKPKKIIKIKSIIKKKWF